MSETAANLWGREPAMILALVGALITLAVSFGADVEDNQVTAIIAVVQIALGLITRSRVTAV